MTKKSISHHPYDKSSFDASPQTSMVRRPKDKSYFKGATELYLAQIETGRSIEAFNGLSKQPTPKTARFSPRNDIRELSARDFLTYMEELSN